MSYTVFQMAIAFQRAEHLHIVLNLRHNVYLRLVHQILHPVHQPPHHLMNLVKKVSFAIKFSVLGSMGAGFYGCMAFNSVSYLSIVHV